MRQKERGGSTHLDYDFPGFQAGAVVDADVAAECLPQIDRPSHKTHKHQRRLSSRAAHNILVQKEMEKLTRRPVGGRGGRGARGRRRCRGGGSDRGR